MVITRESMNKDNVLSINGNIELNVASAVTIRGCEAINLWREAKEAQIPTST
jgi:hypothetical protein